MDIIDQLLILDVDERLGTAGAESVKDHAWFSSVNWDTIQDKPGPFCPTTGDIEDTTYFDNRGLTMEFESDSSTSRGDVYKNYTLLDKQNQLMLGKMRLQKEQEHGSGEWPRRGCSLDIRTSAGEHSRHRSYGATELFRELAGINGPILVCDPHDAYCTAIVPLCSHVTHVKTPADAEQALAETSFETVFVAVDLGLARDGRMIAGESIVDMVRNSKLNSVSRVVALADQGVGWSDGNLPFPFSAQAFKEFIK